MKAIYRSMFVMLFVVVIFSLTNYAQGNDNATGKAAIAKKAFEVCPPSLNSDIPGIVESTIYNIILIKKYYPSADYSSIIKKLDKIAETNSDPSIRFKAHLASIYLGFSDVIHVQPMENVYSHEYIYKQITKQLGNELLVSSK